MLRIISTLVLSLTMLWGLSACQKTGSDADNPEKKVAPHALDKES